MPEPSRPSARELVAVAVAVLIGAFLRLYELDYAQFRPDDEGLWTIAQSFLASPRPLTRGIPSSFGLSNGPFQAYLIAPGAALTHGPIGAYVAVALINVVGLVLFWRFARRYWGVAIALLALLFFATNPWAVIFSRRLWGNDLVAPFTVLLLTALSAWIARGRGRDLVLAFVWLTIATQTYVVALVHLPLMALGLLLRRRQIRRGPLALGLAIAIVGMLPYAARSAIRELGALGKLMARPNQPPVVDLESLRFVFHLVSSDGYQAFATQTGGMVDATSGWALAASLATMAAMALGVALTGVESWRALRQGRSAAAAPGLLALMAIFLPALLLIRHVTPVYPYYLVTGLPMHYLFAAIGGWRAYRWLAEALPRAQLAPRLVGAALLSWVVGTHLALAQVFFAGIHGYWTLSDYGLPLHYTLELSARIQQAAREAGTTRVLVGGAEEHAGVLHRTVRRDLPQAQIFDPVDTVMAPSPSVPAAIYAFAATEPRIAPAVASASDSRVLGAYDVPGEGLSYRLVSASPAALAELYGRQIATKAAVRVQDKVVLDGYTAGEALAPGRTDQLTLAWRIPDHPVDAPELTGFVRLVDTGNAARGGRDFPFVSTTQWQPGDRIFSWLTSDTPPELAPGAYAYRLGLYSVRPTGEYDILPVVDERGQPLGETLRIGWLTVRGPTPPEPQVKVGSKIGPAVTLVGYDLRDTGCGGARRLDLALQWSADRRLDRDYTVFVHVVGPDGKMVVQHDAQPQGGRLPTGAWLVGDRIVDTHPLDLPAGAPRGLKLLVGMYSLPSGERLGGPEAAITLPAGPADC